MKINRINLLLLVLGVSIFSHVRADSTLELVILGVTQDAGYPQLNCYQPHCMAGWQDRNKRKLATSFAIIDHQRKTKYLFEATPDIRRQLYQLQLSAPDKQYKLSGIFLTHAHIGHYTGLMHMGREAASTNQVAVYAMPKMANFLRNNGPWSQLVKLKNITLMPMTDGNKTRLSDDLAVTPMLVPHRDEYSETVGFKITAGNKNILFIPDIDKWQKWNQDLGKILRTVDFAMLDGTFFAGGELPNRNMSEVPHPFVVESMALLKGLPKTEKVKVHFIHFNHTNPLLNPQSEARKIVKEKGFNFMSEGQHIKL